MARSITTPPGQDASPSLVTPPQFVSLLGFANDSLVPIYTPGWREALQELSVSPKNTTLQRPQPGLEPVPLDPGMPGHTKHVAISFLCFNIIPSINSAVPIYTPGWKETL